MVGSLLSNMNDPFARMEAGQDRIDFSEFSGSKAFDVMGFADSEGASSGRAGTQEVDAGKLEQKELQRQKREERDKTNELIELGYQLRQARLAQVFDGLSEEALDFAVDETLKNIDEVADKHGLDDQQKTQLESWLVAYKTASPEEKAEIREKIAENYPSVANEMADTAEAYDLVRAPNNLSASEAAQQEVSEITNDTVFEVQATQIVSSDEVEVALVARDGASFASSNEVNSFLASVSPSAEFNAQALGEIASADIEPVEPKPVTSGPALA